MSEVADPRLRRVNEAPIVPGRDFVLYWMIAARRLEWSFALDRAVALARELKKPLVVLEGLRCDYRFASDRLHAFVLDGMRDNGRRAASAGVLYYPYVEPEPGAGKGLLAAMGRRACAVVTDDFPCFMLPSMVRAAGRILDVRLEAVDGNGLLPMRVAGKDFPTAYAFRRFLQKSLPSHLSRFPEVDALRAARLPRLASLPDEITARWPTAALDLARLPIDHSVAPTGVAGGPEAAGRALRSFLESKLRRYADDRSEPEKDATSGLSPYLHFGHLSPHRILAELATLEGWSPSELATSSSGQRSGWWGMSASAESFLDELVTWRELGYNFCAHRDDHDRFASLPEWAKRTLSQHASDRREHLYELAAFERSATHDPLWNAAQTQLVREGRIHNYLRMLWGKKILEWTRDPEEALEVMIELNNKYALDGRNPNSYSGIFWVLGRYDRPWAPERPIFGVIRYMSSQNTARKLKVKRYLERYAATRALRMPPGEP